MSWKIKRAKFKNFAHIYSGMGKYDIDLDLSDSINKINVMVGKMGSGKSSILGHLQPFSSLGTLDSRNQDSIVLQEKDGHKILIYTNQGNEFIVKHEYIWNKNTKSHNTRSYLELNGEELNPNGNSSSFKDLIKDHFGIEQSFLRLLRLGPMVANLINMKSTERKAFVASLIKDTEIYSVISKKIKEEQRKINTHLSILTNKLTHLDASKYDIFSNQIEKIKSRLIELENQSSKLSSEIATYEGQNSILLNGMDLEKIKLGLISLQGVINNSSERKLELLQILSTSNEYDIKEISKHIGTYSEMKRTILEDTSKVRDTISQLNIDIAKYEDIISIQNSNVNLNELEEKCRFVEEKYFRYEKMYDRNLSDRHSYSTISAFINNLPIIISAIEDVSNYNKEDILFAYKNANINSLCEKKINILEGKKYNLQSSISNIKYSSTYNNLIIPYTPPFCPTEACPFKVTHPYTIKKNNSKSVIDEKIVAIQSEIQAVNIQIELYNELPILRKRILSITDQWENTQRVLNDLNCLNEKSIINILTDFNCRRNWYDHDKLISVLEKYKIKEEFHSFSNQYFTIKNEIETIKSSPIEKSRILLRESKENLELFKNELIKCEGRFNDASNELNKYEKIALELSSRKEYEEELNNLENFISGSINDYELESKNVVQIESNLEKIKVLSDELVFVKVNYSQLNKENEELLMKIKDIEYTKEEYSHLYKDKEINDAIIKATSPSNGIPLIMVKKFLDSCMHNINELIYDVFEDDLEIIDFSIDMDSAEFNIPYMINGEYVSDISKASQGQKSIISIALSFALIRESLFDYNIMLLDEVDGPLYKTDREKFITLLYKQLSEIQADQVFFCSHNNTFEGHPTNVIMTTPESIDKTYNRPYRLYGN